MAVVIFSLVGFLWLTQAGRKFTQILINDLGVFAKTVGNFVSTFSKIKPSTAFEFELSVEKESVWGQSFSFSDSKFFSTCKLLSLKIDGKNWETSEKINISLEGRGSLDFDANDKAKLEAEATSLQFNNFKTSGVKVEMEFLPEKIYLSNVTQEVINFTSATGKVLKKSEGLIISANFTKGNLKIENFFGSLEIKENLTMYGVASKIEINGKGI